jgi:uncharacterized delta-60 repeat protein
MDLERRWRCVMRGTRFPWLVATLLVTALLSMPPAAAATQVGLLDSAFGGDGRVTTDLSAAVPTEDGISDVAVQPDGKIIAAGLRNSSTDQWMAIARYLPDGRLDKTFGGGGVALTHFRGGAFAREVALQPDGKIVAAGDTWIGSPRFVSAFAVARFNSDGTLDKTFSTDGRVRTPIGDDDSYAFALALQSDGRIVVGGGATEAGASVFAIARYTADGSLDGSFGAGGTTTTSFGTPEAWASDVAVQADGDIVAVGIAGSAQNGSAIALARYGSDGSADATFGTGGIVTTSFGDAQAQGSGLTLQPDGKIVVGGTDASGDFLLVRYQTDGSLDPTFAGDGMRRVSFSVGRGGASDVSIEPDGTIVAVGSPGPGDDTFFAVARLATDGSLDQRFSGDGKVLTSFRVGASAAAVAIGPDGAIVVGGRVDTAHQSFNTSDFASARYVVPTSRPDARLRSRWGEMVGDDLYNETGRHQTLNDVARSQTTFTIQLENDGSANDSFTVLGDRSDPMFTVRYLYDGVVVTKRVVAGTFTVGTIEAGGVTNLKVQIHARSSAEAGTSFGPRLWVRSTTDLTKIDTVRGFLHID